MIHRVGEPSTNSTTVSTSLPADRRRNEQSRARTLGRRYFVPHVAGTSDVVIICDSRRDRLVPRRECVACVHTEKNDPSHSFPRLRTGCPARLHGVYRPSNVVGLRTRRGTARSRRGLPVACYESCQSPECNRYWGPEVGIEPIRSAPPRACRRPGRFIMLISLRQGSPRALSLRLASHRLPARPCPFLLPPRATSARCRTRAKREKAKRTRARRRSISGEIGLVSQAGKFVLCYRPGRSTRPNDYLHLARKHGGELRRIACN